MKPNRSERWFFVVSSLVYLGLVWFLSGVWRTGGLDIFVSGVLLLLVCLGAAWRGRRRPLFALHLTVVLTASTVGALEGLLHLFPGVLKGTIANAAYQRYYYADPGGMYLPDRHLGFVPRPNFSCEAYWQGYWWHHATNAAGYRGPLVDRADAVFLGDSLVYGHGVENEQTAASRFGALTGWKVANLGYQATCPVQMAIHFRHIGCGLHPKAVFLCSHFNDLYDVVGYYDRDELKRYTASDPSAQYEPKIRHGLLPSGKWAHARIAWNSHLGSTLRLGGALAAWVNAWRSGKLHLQNFQGSPVEHYAPWTGMRDWPFVPLTPEATDDERLAWKAHCQALAQVADLCRREGTQLVLFDIGYPNAFSQAIEDVAHQLGVTYSPAGRVVLQRQLAGEDMYLVDDAHWSIKGNEVLAEELRRAVQK